MPTLVAHRAGNDPATARAAADRGFMVEIDVHLLRGRLEARHEKVLRPTSLLWERWYFLPRQTRPAQLNEVLQAMESTTPLMLDLKCFTRKAARQIRDSVPESHPLVVSTRSWWLLKEFRNRSDTLMLRSCGSKRQLWFATSLPGLGDRVGIVAHERLLTSTTLGTITLKTPVVFSWAISSVERGQDLALSGLHGLIVDDLELAWPQGDWASERGVI